jgi:hypothetical protein
MIRVILLVVMLSGCSGLSGGKQHIAGGTLNMRSPYVFHE